MLVVQCYEEIDRQFKGDVPEPGSDRSKLFFQRTLTLHCAVMCHRSESRKIADIFPDIECQKYGPESL